MSRRIVVAGSGGRLGAALCREWRAAGLEVLGFDRQAMDLASDAAIRAALEPLEFGVLVNCAALTNVDHCETHETEAFRANAEAVGTIAALCSAKEARCIHISTDYVFDGEKGEPYTEEDEALPISVYGKSKRAGEVAALAAGTHHLVARVSWVFGPDRPSFVDQILARAQKEENVQAISDKWAVPTYTFDAAQLLRPLLFDVPVSGLLHLCNTGACTWQEYGQLALDVAAASGVKLRAQEVGALHLADLKAFIAKRPPFTAMDTTRLAALLGHSPRPWQDAVAEYVRDSVARAAQ